MNEETNIPEEIKLYDSIETLTLERYIIVVCKNDLSQLTESGNPTIEQLQAAWINVISEHQQRRNDPNAETELELRQEREAYENKAYRVNIILSWLRIRYSEAFVAKLIEYGYAYEFTPETYLEDLVRVEAELESEASYFLQEEMNKEHIEPTEKAFISTLIQIQKHLRACPMLTPKQMASQLTVAEYDDYCNEYDEYIKSLTTKENTEDGDD